MKYYQPELEEFHVGFEYDFLEQHGSPNEKWVSKVLTEISDGEDDMYLGNTLHAIEKYERVYLRNAVRVKYLDEQDIEDLGWILEKTIYSGMRHKELRYILNNMYLSFYPDIKHCCIHNGKEDYFESWGYFSGQIKNKSELRKLMKQLGIIQ